MGQILTPNDLAELCTLQVQLLFWVKAYLGLGTGMPAYSTRLGAEESNAKLRCWQSSAASRQHALSALSFYLRFWVVVKPRILVSVDLPVSSAPNCSAGRALQSLEIRALACQNNCTLIKTSQPTFLAELCSLQTAHTPRHPVKPQV